MEVECDCMIDGQFDNHCEIDIINDTKNPCWIIYSCGVCDVVSFQYITEFILSKTDSCINN